MRVLLVNDTEWHYHWGCYGTSRALKEQIQKLGFELISITIRQTKIWVNVPNTRSGFEDPNVFNKFCATNPDLISQIQTADVLVINGEGTIHGGLRSGPLGLLYVAYIAKIHFKKNVQIINHQVYLIDFSATHPCFGLPAQHNTNKKNEEARTIYSIVYGKLDFVAIREYLSFEEIKHWNPTTILAFDCLPLYIKDHYDFQKAIKKSNKVLVVGGSVAWKPQALPAIAKYLQKMHQDGYTIKILVGANADPAQDDQEFVRSLGEHLENTLWSLVNADNMELWLDTIREADLLVSGRFHYTIAAACLGTRFIMLNSNTLKNHALSEILGALKPLCYFDKNLFEQLSTRTRDVLKMSAPQGYLEKFCVAAEINFYALRQLKTQPIPSFLP